MAKQRQAGEGVSKETTGEMPMDDAERAPEAPTDPTHEPIRMHQRIALRLLREGSKHRAFTELVRTTRDIPMNGVLASAIAGIAVRADSVEAGVSVLKLGLDDAEGKERVGVRRALARLLRRSDRDFGLEKLALQDQLNRLGVRGGLAFGGGSRA